MRGGRTSLRKTLAAPSRNTPISQAAPTTAEPMIQRLARSHARERANTDIETDQVSVEDTAWTMV